MNISMEYYKIFYYVARYHNFTKAAKVLGNSQPNVTRAMNCLEQQLGRILFVRTNRGAGTGGQPLCPNRKGCIPDQRGDHALFLCEKRI